MRTDVDLIGPGLWWNWFILARESGRGLCHFADHSVWLKFPALRMCQMYSGYVKPTLPAKPLVTFQ